MDQIPSADQSIARIVDTVHSIASDAIPQGLMIGVVEAPPPALVVRVNTIMITHEEIYLNDYWKIGHHREAKGHIVSATQNRAGGSGMAEFASHNHDIDNDYTDTINMTDTLRIGDLVTVHPIHSLEGQMYYIGQKVVKL